MSFWSWICSRDSSNPSTTLYHADSQRIIHNAQQLIAQKKGRRVEILFMADNHALKD